LADELKTTDAIMDMLNQSLPDERIGVDGVAAMLREYGVPDSDPIPLGVVAEGDIPILYLPHYMGLPEMGRLGGSAMVDIYCAEEEGFYLNTSERSVATVSCGFRLALPEDIVAQVVPLPELVRIGVVAQTMVIDSSHRGEVEITLVNLLNYRQRIERGQRIAQLVFTGNVIRSNLVSVMETSWSE